MSRFPATLSGASGSAKLGTLHKPRALTQWNATFFAKGTFSGATISWYWADAGDTVNLLPMTDYNGALITSTAADSWNSNFGNGNTNSDAPSFYAQWAGGSTATSITAGYLDNQG